MKEFPHSMAILLMRCHLLQASWVMKVVLVMAVLLSSNNILQYHVNPSKETEQKRGVSTLLLFL